MASDQSVSWLRRFWRKAVPLAVRNWVGTYFGLLLNYEATKERLARDKAYLKALDEYYLRESEWRARGGHFQAPENLPPGMLSEIDMAAIAQLAKEVPPGGLIVDVGSLAGRTTTLWCIYSKAGRIVSIDPWENHAWNEHLRTGVGSMKDAFLRNVKDKRVEAIQGYSPQCAGNWVEPIDLYWEDGDHSNPTCANSIGFWSNHVKPGGIACGHDYHILDVKSTVDALATRWGAEVHLFGSVWWMKRPANA